MDFERIKSVKLLKTLKGTDDDGKQLVWLAGTVWKKKPYPRSIMQELGLNRPGMLEVEYMAEEPVDKQPAPQPETETVEETLDVTPDDTPKEVPKKPKPKAKAAKAKVVRKKATPRRRKRKT